MRVVVLSAPGREAITWPAMEGLSSQNPGFPFWVYRSNVAGPREEFWRMLYACRGDDVLALEDDIICARNFFRYAEWWPAPMTTSFFSVRRPVRNAPVSPEGFSFCQAVKLPAAVLDRLLATPARAHHGTWGQDDDLGFRLQDLCERVIYHRSLVQHVGSRSISWGPDVTLDHRTAMDFPGLEFDCMSIDP